MSPPEGISLPGEQTASGCDGLSVSVTCWAPGPVLVTAPPQPRSPGSFRSGPAFPRQKIRHSPSVSAEEWAEHIQREPLAARSLAHWADKAEAGTQSEGESEVQTTLWVNVGLFNTPPKGRTDACWNKIRESVFYTAGSDLRVRIGQVRCTQSRRPPRRLHHSTRPWIHCHFLELLTIIFKS